MTAGDRTTTTNETGNFAFRGLPAGSFTISIDREKDFKPVSQSVDIIQFRGSPAQTYTLNLRLEYKDQERAEPSVVDAQFAGVPQTALAHYNEAIKQAQKGEHTAAVLTLEVAVKEHPTFTMAYNELGVQYLRLEKVNEADEAFQKALKIDSAAFPPNLNRGMILFFQKRYSEAQPILRKAVEIKPDSVAGHYFYGQTLANLGLFEEAEKELLIATKVANPEMKEAHRTLAIIYSSRGDKKRGIAQLEAYLKAAPDAADADQLKALLKKLKGSN
jgi:Flp pilus assembly protein TadD